jgi:hypothetical protein
MSKIPWENLMLTTSDKGMTRNDENENEEKKKKTGGWPQ